MNRGRCAAIRPAWRFGRSGAVPAYQPCDQLDKLHDGDDGKGKAQRGKILGQTDVLKAEGFGKERNIDYGSGQNQRQDGGAPEVLVLVTHGENGAVARTQVEGMEDFAHGHRQEGHGHAVRAVGDLPDAGFHIMADEVCGHGDHADQDPLVEDVRRQPACEHAFPGIPRRPAHIVLFPGFHSQRQGREAVRNQVDPQKMHRLENGKSQDCCHENGQHFAEIGGEQELDGLPDVVINPAALVHGGDDGGEVVVGQNHIGHIFRHVSTGDSHADADIGGFDGGRVVDAVAGHGDDLPAGLPGCDDPHLVLRLYAGVDAVIADFLRQLFVGERIQLRSGNGLFGALQNAKLLGDGHGGVPVVAGDHHGPDTCTVTFGDGVLDLRADGVDHAHQAEEGQMLFQGFRRAVRHPVMRAECRGQHPQRLAGHIFVGLQDRRTPLRRQGDGLAALQDGITALEHFVGRALGILKIPAVRPMDGGHHFAAGVKGRFPCPRRLRFQKTFIQLERSGIVDQRRLCGFPLCAAVFSHRGVGAQRQRGCQERFILSVVLHHSHLILRQGPGLVGADNLRAPQGFHGGQAADYGAAPGHFRYAHGQHQRHDGGKALGDCRHSQADGDHEGGQQRLAGKITGPEHAECKNEYADAQHHPAEDFAQLGQLPLQRRLTVGGVVQGCGNFTHFRAHAGIGDDSGAASVDHGGSHIDHVFPVAQGNIPGPVVQIQQIHIFVDRNRLAGQGGLLNFQAGRIR